MENKLDVELFEFGNESRLKVAAQVQNIENKIILRATISGDLSNIDFPIVSQTPRRMHGLWEIGVFEIFVSGKGSAYTEYNFGFNRHYEIFSFLDYRQHQTPPPSIDNPPKITVETKDGAFTLHVELSEDIVSDNLFSIAAAIKLKNGSVLYFANAHCGDKADFHLERARTLRMPRKILYKQ
ncbi:MAG: hypothetical protein LBU83_02530 [Bacteroidales bacterium]|jgi:hypothetical protein|nr:hypothetical protein [Bacteroidales bacterium]